MLNAVRSESFRISVEGAEFSDFVKSLLESENSLKRIVENGLLMNHPGLFDTVLGLLHATHELKLLSRKHSGADISEYIRKHPASGKMVTKSVGSFLEFFFKYLLSKRGVSQELKRKILQELAEFEEYY